MLKLDNTSGNHRAAVAAESNLLLPPICDACASMPASLFCKADSASLCTPCDAKIHSANPLARRHHRVAIVPGLNYGVAATDPGMGIGAIAEEDEAASWLLLNPVKNDIHSRSYYGTDDPTTFCGVVDEYLDFGDFNYPCHYYNNNNNNDDDDDVARSIGGGDDSSNIGYNYSAFMSHTVPFSKLEVGVVPEESTTMSDNSSISNTRALRGTHDVFVGPLVQMPTQLSAMDREARVLRYREKKKARKFEKRIRYASRKAYAETRPRIKGRFARRASVAEFEVDQLFSASLIAEAAGFGIVPSFEV